MSTLTLAVSGLVAAPAVEVVVSGILASSTTVSLSRSWGGQRATVRGAQRMTKTGAQMVLTDYEAPTGVPVRYTLDEWTAAGTLQGSGVSGPITLESSLPWISDPIDPANAVQVLPGDGAFVSADRPRTGATASRIGSPSRIGAFDVRQDAAAIPLPVLFRTRAEHDAIERVLVQADPVLVRCPPDRAPKPALYLTAAWRVEYSRLRDGECVGRFALTCEEVEAPAASIVIPTRPYGSIAQGQTYGQLAGQYATYLAMQRGA